MCFVPLGFEVAITLVSGAFEHSVLRVWLWKIWCFTLQSMGRTSHKFPICMQHRMFKINCKWQIHVQARDEMIEAILEISYCVDHWILLYLRPQYNV